VLKRLPFFFLLSIAPSFFPPQKQYEITGERKKKKADTLRAVWITTTTR
jgi:hypothetical protein